MGGSRPLDRLASLQRADGSWELGKFLAELLGCSLDDLESEAAKVPGNREQVDRVWATALALAFLEQFCADEREEWELLAAKARRWLDGVSKDPAALLKAAARALRSRRSIVRRLLRVFG